MISLTGYNMIKGYKSWFRAAAVITTVAFLFLQISWAQDLNLLGPAPIENDDNRSGMLSSSELLEAQKRAEALVALKNDIDSFEEPASSTQPISNNLYMQYSDNDVYKIYSPDSFTIDAIRFNEELDTIFSIPFNFDNTENPLTENTYIRLTLPNSTMHLYEYSPSSMDFLSEEKLLETITPDNTLIAYSDGLVDTILKEDGDLARYTYIFDEADYLANIIQSKFDATRVFDDQGNLEYLYIAATEGYTKIHYKDDAPYILTKPNGTTYLYTYEERDGKDITCITLLEYVNEDSSVVLFEDNIPLPDSPKPDKNTAVRIVQDNEGRILEVTDSNLTKYFYKNGVITHSISKDGSETFYYYEYDEEGALTKTKIISGSLTIIYDRHGNIETCYIGEGEDKTELLFEQGKIKKLISDENVLHYIYGENPNTGEEITTLNAYSTRIRTKYDDERHLSCLTFPDNTNIKYTRDESGKITHSKVFKYGVMLELYNYHYQDGRIIVEDQHKTRRIYDAAYNLIGLDTSQGYEYAYSLSQNGIRKLIYNPKDTDQYPPLNIEYRYDKRGTLLSVKRSDNTSITFFKSQVANLLNEEGDVLVGYTYDNDGNLLNVRLVKLRELLKELKNHANLDITDEALNTLNNLSTLLIMGKESITQDGEEFADKSNNLRDTLNDLRTKVQNSADYPIIDQGLEDLDNFNNELPGTIEDAIQEIENYLEEKQEEIQDTLQNESGDVINEYEEYLEGALQQEIIPFVAYYYNKYLGRSPEEEEIYTWQEEELSQIRKELISYLINSPEYIAKLSQRDLIISELKDFLNEYASKEGMERLKLLSYLGIDGLDTVYIEEEDIEKLESNLKGLPIHFASSAIMSLKELIQGISERDVNYEDLTKKALLVDILTGRSLIGQEGELSLSAYALCKVASLEGIELNAYNLKDIEKIKEPTLAFVDNNHYIVIESVEEGIVTYFEPSLGKEGTWIEVDIETFAWRHSGVVIASTKPQGATPLEDERAMLIKGGKGEDEPDHTPPPPPPRLGVPLDSAITSVNALSEDLDTTLTSTTALTTSKMDECVSTFDEKVERVMDDYRLLTGKNFTSITELQETFLQMLPGLQVYTIPLDTTDYLAKRYYELVLETFANPSDRVFTIEDDDDNDEKTLSTYLTNTKTTYDKGGKILKSISETGLVTAYEYDPETGLILSSKEYENGSLIHIYNYTYKDSLAIIEDEKGTKKAYNEFLDLVYIENADGSRYTYSIKDGLPCLTLINEDKIKTIYGEESYVKEYIYNLEGGLREVLRSDGTRLNYVGGLLRTVEDMAGRVLIEYSYNERGELIDVRLIQEREDLQKDIERINENIIMRGDYSLDRLSIKENLAKLNIKRTAEALKRSLIGQIDQMNQRIAYLEASKPGPIKRKTLWWTDTYYPDTSAWDAAIGNIQGYITQIQETIPRVDIEKEKTLNELASQVAFMREEKIPEDINQALISAEGRRDSLLQEIESQEMLPMVYFYYRSLLGRDPNNDELSPWKEYRRGSQPLEDHEYIKATLIALPEYAEKIALVESVAEYIRNYLTENVRAPPEEINAIYAYLKNQSNHFASSAIGSLHEYLTLEAIDISYEDLLKEAILQDILSGALNKNNLTGDLVISLDTISTICKDNGIDIIPAKVGFDKLKDLEAPFIALTNGDHFVIVKEIREDSITIFEPNLGPEGEDKTLTLEQFKNIFTGYILTPEENISPSSILSKDEALSVKGGTFFIGAAILGVLGAITSVASTVAIAVTGIVTGISAAVGTVASAIGGIISGAAGFLGSSSVLSGVSTFLTSGLGGVVTSAIPASISAIPIIGPLLSTVLPWAANFAAGTLISEGLTSLGVNSTITNLITGFITAGPVGLVSQGVAELGNSFGMDPALTNVLACGAGAIVGSGGNIANVMPSIAGKLAQYGIGEIANHYGLDPRLSSVLGALGGGAVTGRINQSFGGEGPNFFDSIFSSVSDELIQIGLREAQEKLEMDRLAYSLLASLGAETFDYLLSPSQDYKETFKYYTSAEDTLNLVASIEEGRETGNVWEAFKGGLSTYLLSGAAQSLSQSALSVVHNLQFSLQETSHLTYEGFLSSTGEEWELPLPSEGEGIENPLLQEEGGLSLFENDQAMPGIDYFEELLKEQPTINRYLYEDDLTDPLIFNLENMLLGGGIVEENLSSFSDYAKQRINQTVLNAIHGLTTEKDISPKDNVLPAEDLRYVKNDETIFDNIMNIGGALIKPPNTLTYSQFGMAIINETIKEVLREYSDYDYIPENPDIEKKDNFRFIYVNGISNPREEGYSSLHGDVFKYELVDFGLNSNSIYLLPTYERGNVIKDSLIWLSDASTDKMTNEIIAKMDYELSVRPESQKEDSVIATLYSGGYNCFMKALDARPDYNVETVIATGAAALKGRVPWMRDIKNHNIKRVVNIYGAEDILRFTGLTGTMKFNNVETINIKILGAGHGDYSYDPQRGTLNVKSSAFVREVIKKTNLGIDKLKDFLVKPENNIEYDSKTNTYIVDPSITDLRKLPEWRVAE